MLFLFLSSLSSPCTNKMYFFFQKTAKRSRMKRKIPNVITLFTSFTEKFYELYNFTHETSIKNRILFIW